MPPLNVDMGRSSSSVFTAVMQDAKNLILFCSVDIKTGNCISIKLTQLTKNRKKSPHYSQVLMRDISDHVTVSAFEGHFNAACDMARGVKGITYSISNSNFCNLQGTGYNDDIPPSGNQWELPKLRPYL